MQNNSNTCYVPQKDLIFRRIFFIKSIFYLFIWIIENHVLTTDKSQRVWLTILLSLCVKAYSSIGRRYPLMFYDEQQNDNRLCPIIKIIF